ncbi:aldehyde dehydrogenase family protein [Sporosarcina soli]|uniref:Aldehyde dehydrogenase family protein n=1 Tax=Sporosarcina soli TaxID=334736 RepID=A0ABW0TQ02_9BACL
MTETVLTVGHFINGVEESLAANDFPSYNPATGQEIARVSSGTEKDVDRAVQSAKQAFEKWKNMSPSEKGDILRNIARRVRKDRAIFGRTDTMDAGRPISHTTYGDTEAVARLFDFFAALPEYARGATIPTSSSFLNYSVREPYGVIGAIVPWNYPMINVATKIAPILACGNTVVLKSAEQAPLAAILLAKIAVEEGLPPGVFNVVNGGPETGEALVSHPDIKKVTFTGSSIVGQKILANNSGIKSSTLELGGKTANIVFPDATMDAAVEGTLFTAFMNQGQTCTAGTRLLIHEAIQEQFLEKLLNRVKELRIGDPFDEQTQIGAVITEKQLKRIEDYIEIGKAEGATLLCGGERLHLEGFENGYFMSPTIFTDVSPDMRIAQEEIFGPILSVISFKDEEEALEIANGTRYGLATSLWTNDVKKVHDLASKFESGIVWINTVHTLSPSSGYGGYKDSGIGLEEGMEAMEQYMRLKTIWVNYGEYVGPFQNK